jgi:tRNA pseudouridine55 synthase
MEGLLLVDKPSGWTSFDVVNYIRKIVAGVENKKPKNIKVGHIGTLDPFATGLLVLLIGKNYTKQAGSLSKLTKTYEITMKLGVVSSTGDPEGEIETVNDLIPNLDDLMRVIEQFTGQIKQVPPSYSAIKVGGQRAYKLARAGKEVVIEPRLITVNKLDLISYDYPIVNLVSDVSSGTYIRSLVSDMGKALSTGAYTLQLRRLNIDTYNVEQAVKVKDIDEQLLTKRLIHLELYAE